MNANHTKQKEDAYQQPTQYMSNKKERKICTQANHPHSRNYFSDTIFILPPCSVVDMTHSLATALVVANGSTTNTCMYVTLEWRCGFNIHTALLMRIVLRSQASRFLQIIQATNCVAAVRCIYIHIHAATLVARRFQALVCAQTSYVRTIIMQINLMSFVAQSIAD